MASMHRSLYVASGMRRTVTPLWRLRPSHPRGRDTRAVLSVPGGILGSMQRIDGHLVLSPTDLTKHVACAHITTLDLEALDAAAAEVAARGCRDRRRRLPQPRLRQGPRARARLPRPPRGRGPRRRGHRGARARAVPRPRLRRSRRCGAASTSSTRRRSSTATGSGSPTSSCASTETAATCGPWRYDIADTKLARRLKVPALLQMATYAARLETLQGVAAAVADRRHRRPASRTRGVSSTSRPTRAVAGPSCSTRSPARARPSRPGSSTAGSAGGRSAARRSGWTATTSIQVAGMRADHRAALIDLGIPTLRSLAAVERGAAGAGAVDRDPTSAAPAGPAPARRARDRLRRSYEPARPAQPGARACRCCPSPTRATSTSTSRATRGPRAARAASTSPASGPGRASSSSSGRTTSPRRGA